MLLAEEPLGANGACLLGSINLANYIIFDGEDPVFDRDSLKNDVHTVVKALNDVLVEGYEKHALPEQRQFAKDWRAIGLGTMGLAEAMIKFDIQYDTQEAIDFTEDVMLTIAKEAVLESLDLAKKHGCYPKCNSKLLPSNVFINRFCLTPEQTKELEEYGLYNSQLLTCAPTGSISNLFQTSGGIEPYFSFSYTRLTKSLEGKDKPFEVREKVVDDYIKRTGDTDWKTNPIFVCSQDIDPNMRVEIQSSAQMYIDASISSTINLPESATVKEVEKLYCDAWATGCKGLTIFRSGCKRVAILTTGKKEEEKKDNTEVIFDSVEPIHRSTLGTTYGCTQQKKCACGKLYITCNKDKNGHIVELFTHTSKGGICQANLNAVTRLASLGLRSGIKVNEVMDQLKGIHCPACQALKAKGQNVDGLSCPDIMSKVLLDSIGIQEIQEEDNGMAECPECHKKTLRHEGGCVTCTSCGYSKCN